MRPDEGQIDIDGQDPYSLSADGRAEFRAANIGFVFQQFHLVPYLNVFDNIMAPGMAAPQGSNGAASDARERATQLMEQFGLADRSQHVPGKLSSGERQRVAMARALLNEPRLILADEPTGDLDRESATSVMNLLSSLNKEHGRTIVMVTHDPKTTNWSDTTLHLEKGKLIEAKESAA